MNDLKRGLIDPPCRHIPRLPVGVVEAADADGGVFAAGVDELAVAHVDAVVRETPLVGVLEEDEVTGQQVFRRDVDAADDLVFHRALEVVSEHLIHDVIGKSGAIESARCRAAPEI